MKKTNLRQYLLAKYGKRELEILAKLSSQKMKYITQGKK
jgi:hypothetical protein